MLSKSKEFKLLDDKIKDWIVKKGWTDLRSIQQYSIQKIVKEKSGEDLILFAPTAGGKTMAAFIPLLNKLVAESQSKNQGLKGYEIMYICPTKALIQQQSQDDHDIARLCNKFGIKVNPWMGDISADKKEGSWNDPSGVLIITPESLEGRFVKRPFEIQSRLGNLKAVIIDELHAYFESERGPQLISLLTRLEDACGGKKIQRIGLSATLGSGHDDLNKIFSFLRPGTSNNKMLHSQNQSNETVFDFDITLSVHKDKDVTDFGLEVRKEIAAEIRKILDPQKAGIVFTNSRREAERYTNLLNTETNQIKELPKWSKKANNDTDDDDDTPSTHVAKPSTNKTKTSIDENEPLSPMDKPFHVTDPHSDKRRYWPHHGSLNKAIRTHAERRMRDPQVPCILVATTTLELGIDVGEIKEVVQLGPGSSVASLRQRLGRSGRPVTRKDGSIDDRSKPKLYIFIRESGDNKNDNIINKLMLSSFQTLAQVALLREGKFESPRVEDLHLSTFVQQILSLIHQHRDEGLTVSRAYQILVEKGPFAQVGNLFYTQKDTNSTKRVFDALIERLRTRHPPLIDVDQSDQEGEHELFLTSEGEKITSKSYFLAAFKSRPEYTIKTTSSKILGTIGLGANYGTGDKIIYGGLSLEIIGIDHAKKIVEVKSSSGGKAPYFLGDSVFPSNEVIKKMKELYKMDDLEFEKYIKETLKLNFYSNGDLETLKKGRLEYVNSGLRKHQFLTIASDTISSSTRADHIWFPWAGEYLLQGVLAALRYARIPASPVRIAILIQDRSVDEIHNSLQSILHSFPGLDDLVRNSSVSNNGKFDGYLSPVFWRKEKMKWLSDEEEIKTSIQDLEQILKNQLTILGNGRKKRR